MGGVVDRKWMGVDHMSLDVEHMIPSTNISLCLLGDQT